MIGKVKFRSALVEGEWAEVPVYVIDGREVTEAEFRTAFPPREASAAGLSRSPSVWPQLNDAMAVHPTQVEEAREDAKRKGVPTDFLPDGRPVILSGAHQKEYAKLYGWRPKRGY